MTDRALLRRAALTLLAGLILTLAGILLDPPLALYARLTHKGAR